MKFAYRGFDRSGAASSGTVEADTKAEASEKLRRDGLFVTELNQMDGGSAQTVQKRARAGTGTLKKVAVFMRQLSVLVATGTPVVEALQSMERQAKDKQWKAVVESLRGRVEEGVSLSEAMGEQSEVFDAVCRSLVAAGESGGNLSTMLDRLATLLRRQVQVRNAIMGAMVYPILLISVSLCVLVAMVLFVVPRFTGLFETLDMPLPPSTEMLILVSDFGIQYWWLILGGMVAGVFGLKGYLGTPGGQRMLDTVAIRLPQVGRITRSFATARIARLLGVLLESRVPLLEALELTREASGNCHYRELIERAEEAVSKGEPVSRTFAGTSLIAGSVSEAVRNGEESGNIGSVLLNVAEFLDEDNEVLVKSLTSIVEPVILILLGLIVAVVAISMFLPLFDLTAMAPGGA